MFKKFQQSTDISSQTPVKSSVQRSIRLSILSQWKITGETLEGLWPKRDTIVHVKCRDHISIYTLRGEPVFFRASNEDEEKIYPTLRTLHKYPFVLPAVGVDRGAIRFLLQGAHMMCPGMTSKGGYLPPAESELMAGTPVALHAEGKEHAVGIGLLKLSTEEIKRVNKNVGVETITYLGDDLWKVQEL